MYNQVRLYAVSTTEFPKESDILDYLNLTVPNNGYEFHFIKYGIICPTNTLIYYRYRGAIIAKAVARERVRKILYLEPNTIMIRRTSLPAHTIGITWWKDNCPKDARILVSDSYRGPLFVDPASIPIIDNVCF